VSSLDVLIIDDNKTTRDMLRTILEFEGHNVSCCENGRSGLDLMKSKFFEIIVTDYLMPGMNGDEVTRLARRFSPDSFIIGCSVDARARQFAAAGADAFLNKNHVIHQLLRLIEQRVFLQESGNVQSPDSCRGAL
jgi:CheY-like chemotaxis protein